MGEDELEVLFKKIDTIGYAKPLADGSLQTEFAWEGTRIVKMKDGKCIKTTHSELKIVADGKGQRPEYLEQKIAVDCP